MEANARKPYFYTSLGGRHGPVTGPQLKVLAAQGALLPTDTVWHGEDGAATVAGRIQGLFPPLPVAQAAPVAKALPVAAAVPATGPRPAARPGRDVFLSYSSQNKPTADAICAALEREKVRCWIAPRDILPGVSYAEAIIDGINSCRLVVVVLSAASNGSPQVLREVERAVHKGIPVIPFRIEDVTPSKSMEYFLSAPHWLDALTPPVEAHIDQLTAVVKAVLDPDRPAPPSPAPSGRPRPATPVQPVARRAAEGGPAEPPRSGSRTATPRRARDEHGQDDAPPRRPRRWLWASLAAGVVAVALAVALAVVLSPRTNRLSGDFAEYRRQLATGHGSVVFLQKSAPTRFPEWQAEADARNPIGQLFVGRCYQEGVVVGRDEPAAIPWLEKAAAQGNAYAMFTLGMAYQRGQGVAADPSKALQWYTKAADAGNPVGMRAIGDLYSGSAVDKPNPERALEWYRKAADAGDPVGMRLVAECYRDGTGVAKDTGESERWYRKAADAGDAYTVGRQLGDRMAPHFAAYQVKEATAAAKANALSALRDQRAEYDRLDLISLEAIYRASDLRNATSALDDLKPDDPLRALHDELTQRYITCYAAAAKSERFKAIVTYSEATRAYVERRYKDRRYDVVTAFWEQSYKDLALTELGGGDEIDALVQQLGWSAPSLIRSGQRKEAAALIEATLGLCTRSLRDRPWDWYTKEAYAGLCFEAADAWIEVGDRAAAQPLLRRGWEKTLTQFGKEELLTRYADLPQKGKAPAAASDADRQFFERFAKTADKKASSIKRFTIPCDFSGQKYPFHVYVLAGKRGYVELQDQFRWLKEVRGGTVPQEVRDSFQRLNAIAVENDVDFMELCVYALGTAVEESETEQAVREIVSKHFDVAADKIDAKKPLSAPPVKLDTLGEVELVMALEEKFDIKVTDAAMRKANENKPTAGIRALTLEQVVKMVAEIKKASSKATK